MDIPAQGSRGATVAEPLAAVRAFRASSRPRGTASTLPEKVTDRLEENPVPSSPPHHGGCWQPAGPARQQPVRCVPRHSGEPEGRAALRGAGETLRVSGTARITADPALRARFAVQGKPPATVLSVTVREIYAHCAKSAMRSRLWGDRARPARLPTNGELLAAHTAGGTIDPALNEAEYQARIAPQTY